MLVFYFDLQGFSPEDGGSVLLQNVGINLQVQTTLQPRKPTSASSEP
jgi:hypothetical protein